MKADLSHLEPFRLTDGQMATNPGDRYGMFIIHRGYRQIRAMMDDGEETGWEHVSVSILIKHGKKVSGETPSWDVMCEIKSLFWDDEEPVMQLHPPKSDWVNNHSHCLHLWRPLKETIPLPNSLMVGIKELGTLT